ncbi:MAG: hypothetical protein ACTHK2_05010 [Dokdonella sp.]|uniref:hypothetical protein n=1 Tax=Dokdonella sp. TaxID=2291710 RepID=UPI003F81F67E
MFDGAKVLISGAVAAAAELGVVIGQTIDKVKGSESAYTSAMIAIRDSAIDASKNGVDALRLNSEKLVGNLEGIAGVSGPASASLAAVGAAAARVHASFSNVLAGVESTRKALQRFDVPPGTFANVIGGAEQAGKAMADLAKRTEDAQREANAARANFDRLARSSQSNTQELQRAAAALDQANARLHALKERATEASTGADTLDAALHKLGVTSQADLAKNAADAANALDSVFSLFQSGKATIEDVRAAFEGYAQKQLEAVKNSDAWKQQEVKAALEVKRAMLGLSEIKVSPDFSKSASGARELEQQAQRTGEAVKSVGEQGREAAKEISDGFAQLAGIYTGWTSKFEETSHSAALRFQELTKSISEFGVSLNPLVEADVIGLARLGDAISRASAQTKAEIEEQKARVAELTAQYQNMSASALAAQATLAGGAEALAKSFEAQAAAARNGESQLSLLGASDLSPLASALESVAAKTRQIANEALSARQQFAAMANDIRQQIAQQQGDDAKAENLRFQAQLEQLRQQAQEKGILNSREYADLVAEATKLHKLKMDQIKEQAAAAKKAADDAAARAAAAAKEGKGGGTDPTSGAPSPQLPTTPAKSQLEITLNGTQLGSINPGDSAAIERLARALLPEMMRQIRAAAANIPQGFRPGGPVR